MAILSDAVLNFLSSPFQPESDSDSVNHSIDPKGYLSDSSSRSSVVSMKNFVECSDDELPGYLLSPSTSNRRVLVTKENGEQMLPPEIFLPALPDVPKADKCNLNT